MAPLNESTSQVCSSQVHKVHTPPPGQLQLLQLREKSKGNLRNALFVLHQRTKEGNLKFSILDVFIHSVVVFSTFSFTVGFKLLRI